MCRHYSRIYRTSRRKKQEKMMDALLVCNCEKRFSFFGYKSLTNGRVSVYMIPIILGLRFMFYVSELR